jgi:branched-chain amino acid transport system ATP-binding protein
MMPSESATGGCPETILFTRGLTKQFGGLTAVKDLELSIRKREILSLIGPNGAGKTTVFNLITGFYRPEEGEIVFKGKKITGRYPIRSLCPACPEPFRIPGSLRR